MHQKGLEMCVRGVCGKYLLGQNVIIHLFPDISLLIHFLKNAQDIRWNSAGMGTEGGRASGWESVGASVPVGGKEVPPATQPSLQ